MNPKNCLIIGDRITDIIAGYRAGLKTKILISNCRSLEMNDSGDYAIAWPNILGFHLANDIGDAGKIIEEWWKNR